MNSLTPAAHVRAGTGFRNTKAGAGSIVHCAWNRSLLWLLVRFLPLVLLTLWSVNPAQADGVKATITNGQTVNGSLTASGFDTYTFTVPAGGGSFVLSVGETGRHTPNFVPEIDLAAPVTGDGPGMGRPLNTLLEVPNAVKGTWSVKVHRADEGGTTAGSYALTLVQVPGSFVQGGLTAVAMTKGADNPGSTNRGKVEVWTFSGVAGQTETLTLNHTGDTGIGPEIYVYTPTGDFGGGTGCAASCTQDVPITNSGVYTVIAFKNDSDDVTSTYTLSVKDKN